MSNNLPLNSDLPNEAWLLGNLTGELYARPVQGDLIDCPECATTPQQPTDGYSCDLYKCNCGACWTIHANYLRVKYNRLSYKPGQVEEFEISVEGE